ncbi:MAG: hypothetical protein KDA75_16785, partial [Planctomycetaceae bacterium]|nr:hypothetical protein [Planctomycetaceae bacterium]
MSSPFQVFRKHQKILLVVLVGLSMLSFVIFDAVQNVSDISQMPPTLIVLTIAALVGAVAWVVGINNHKSSEYGSMGLIAGVAIGLLFVMQSRKSDAVSLGEFEMTHSELNQLVSSRFLANRFIAGAIQESNPDMGDMERNYTIRGSQFGFGFPEEQVDRDVILGDLLRREAAKIGMDLPDSAVHDYIKRVTNNKMTKEAFRDVRNQLGASEADIVESIRQELLARQAANALYSRVDLPPAVDWEFSQRLQIRESATTAAIPISAFIDEKAEPPAAELEQLFQTYRENRPGFTPTGRVEEGRPGFVQPSRIRLAYVTPDYQAFESQVKVTDEEIAARYQRDYVEPSKGSAGSLLPSGPLFPGGPTLPETKGPALPGGDDAVPPEPAAETPPETNPETPSETESKPTPPADPESTNQSEPEKSESEQPEPEQPQDDGSSCDDAPPAAENAGDSPPPAADEAEKPAEEKPAEEKPAEEKPAPETAEPAAAAAKDTKPAGGDVENKDDPFPIIPGETETAPPTPSSEVPPL